jgi:hypothetical protein
MIPITFLGVAAYLIDDAPIWDSPVSLDAELPTDTERGLTQRETRRPLADTLRLSIQYRAVLQGSAVTTFRNSLQALTTERILCPLWWDQFAAGGSPTVTTDYYVLMGDGAAPAIQPSGAMPFGRPAYPMLVGILSDLPDPSLLTDELSTVDITFKENDVYYVTFPAFVPPTGLGTINGTRPLFPFRPNWATPPRSGSASVEIDRQQIGQGRISADAFYAQPARRPTDQAFTLQNSEPWQLLRMFLDFRGVKERFWLPVGLAEARLTADVAAIDTALTVDNPTGRGTNTKLLIDDLTNRVPVTITGTAGSNWNLSGAVGTAFVKKDTRLESLILARFQSDRLSLSWESAQVAQCRCQFVELPWEAAAVAGEVDGTTIGEMATNAYLFHFSVAYPGAAQDWYFTGFERNLSDGSNSFLTGHWEFDSITEADSLERQQCRLKSRTFVGNPLNLLIPFQLEWPLMVEVFECDVAGGNASNLRRVFYGEVVTVDPDGPYIGASLKSNGPIVDRRAPRVLDQPGCNVILFEPKCGLLAADWMWQGVVASYNATTRQLVLNNIARVTGPPATLDAGYFAAGYLYFGAGANVQYRTISDSLAAAGTSITLYVGTPFTTVPGVGATVTFHPGCDGDYLRTCVPKFNNRANNRGFPFAPSGNPSLLKVSKNVSSGGKK